MKIGFSSSICPQWDLQTMVQQARDAGCQAIEVCAPQDGRESPAWAGLADEAGAKKVLADAGIELTCLATDYSLHWAHRRTLEDHKQRLQQTLALAGRLGCPYVSLKTGSVTRFQSRDRVLLRIVHALRELAHQAAESRATLLVENASNIAGSRDLWFIVDAAAHPSVRCCWDPCQAKAAGDSTGLAVPRLGPNLCVTHMHDAVFASDGSVQQYVPMGEGQVSLARYLILMNGIRSDTRLIVNWPSPGSPPEPQGMLPASVAWIQAELAKIAQNPELSAYKGDKNAPRFGPEPTGAARATAV